MILTSSTTCLCPRAEGRGSYSNNWVTRITKYSEDSN